MKKLLLGIKHSMYILLFVLACCLDACILTFWNNIIPLVIAGSFLVLVAALFMFLDITRKHFDRQKGLTQLCQDDLRISEKEISLLQTIIKNQEAADRNQRLIYNKVNQSIGLMNSLLKAQEISTNTILAYDKENAKQIVKNIQKAGDTNIRAIEELYASISEDLKNLENTEFTLDSNQFEELKSVRGTVVTAATPDSPVSFVADDTVTDEDLSESTDLLDELSISVDDLAPEEIQEVEVESEPEVVVESEPEVVVSTPAVDPNAKMSDADIAALFESAGLSEKVTVSTPAQEPVIAPEPEPEPAPVVSDPNAAMSDADIAALFAQAEAAAASEPAPEPEPEPAPEPAPEISMEEKLASTGVDLSNPMANLSVDDIAKLFEASGN